jgi:hypothetical protein
MLHYEINPVEDEHQNRLDLLLVAMQANQGEFFRDLSDDQLKSYREKYKTLLPIHHMVSLK